MVPWSELVDNLAPTAYMTALRIVGQDADAEDVIQDVFLEVHRLWQFRDVANWEATLRTLATRRAIDLLRKRKSETGLPERLADSRIGTPESLACGRERQELVRQAIAKLPQQQAEVFSLRYLEDQSHEQIALALGISTHAVASSLHKARVRLETVLQSLLSPTDH